MCGRAGRGGAASRAHLFYSARRKKVNPVVKDYCTQKENCRRLFMLKALGSTERVVNSLACCDVCDANVPAPLHFEALPRAAAKKCTRRAAIRILDKNLLTKLKENLEAEREAYMLEHPNFKILGRNFVCPDSVIEAKFVRSIEDLNVVIRAEMKSRLFRVILRTCRPFS